MNSILQVLFTLPDFQHVYHGNAEAVFRAAPVDPTEHLDTQLYVVPCFFSMK
jgi:hypothetical protein